MAIDPRIAEQFSKLEGGMILRNRTWYWRVSLHFKQFITMPSEEIIPLIIGQWTHGLPTPKAETTKLVGCSHKPGSAHITFFLISEVPC